MQLDREDLEDWSDRVIARPFESLTPPVLEGGSVLRAPARQGAIRAAEERLRVRLPDSYRSFLSISNGAFADWSQPMHVYEGQRTGSSDPWVGLLPIEDVGPLEDALGWVVDLFSSDEFDHGPEPSTQRLNGGEVTSAHGLREALLITSLTSEGGKSFLCLVPVDPPFDVGGEGWEVWDKGHTGFTRWVSFFDWVLWRRRDGWLLGPPQGANLDHLRAMLDEHPERSPSWACGILRGLANGATSTDLVDYLSARSRDGEDPYVRLGAAQALHAHDRNAGAVRLVALLDSDDPTVGLAAQASLRVIGAHR